MPDQTTLDRLGQHAMALYGDTAELVDYAHRPTASAAVVALPGLRARFKRYGVRALSTGLIQERDEECRILTASVPLAVTHFDEVVRQKNGERWRVVRATGGPGHVWWVLQMRQVG